jgi:poly-gamma-glutamate synthesis protein (capsule biosynthesis protein)
MNKKRLLLGAIASLVVFGLALGVISYSRSLQQQTAQDQSGQLTENQLEIEAFDLSFPIVVVAPFKYAAANIEKAAVNPQTTFISTKLKDLLTTLEVLDNGFVNYPEFSEELIQLNKAGLEDRLLLVHPDEVQFTLKALRVEGIHPLRPEQNPEMYSSYPFRVDKKVAVNGEVFTRDYLESIDFQPEQIKRIFAAGEIIPARAVDRLFLNDTNNYTLLFDRFRSEIETAHIAMALLENPISGNPKPCTGCTVFVGDERNAEGFKTVGLDVLSFGNHAGDGGLAAIKRTEEVLAEQGVAIAGLSSKNIDEAAKVAKLTLSGKAVSGEMGMGGQETSTPETSAVEVDSAGEDPIVGIVGFDDVAYFSWASGSRGGANRFSKAGSRGLDPDYERIKSVIGEAKKQVDILIVYPSWGVEYRDSAVSGQQKLAHAIIDAGADIIIGSHPHWVQNFEVYKGKPIFYSLGNFIFDQTHTEETRQSMVVNSLFYKGKLAGFEITPLVMCGYHQTKNNLAGKIISGEISYAQVDATAEKDGCVYWQPKPLDQSSKVYEDIWKRFTRATKIL